MAWPFAESVRPLMRDVLRMQSQGMPLETIGETLKGPHWRRDARDVDIALQESQRARAFADIIRGADATQALGQLWDMNATEIWQQAYGREPVASERKWYSSRPSSQVGVMVEILGKGLNSRVDHRYTVTLNAQWDMSLQDIKDSVTAAMNNGIIITKTGGTEPLDMDTVSIHLIGGVLVDRIEPTLTLTRAGASR